VNGEAIAAAALGLLGGGGGVRVLGRLVGPERDTAIADYYRGVIKDLRKENDDLRGRLRSLEDRITQLELAQDDPPPYLT
jgi:hypothetical protein